MRKRLLPAALALAALTSVVAPATAGPTGGGIASSNVEWLGHHPYVIDGVGGRLVGKWFYATDQNKLMIFDVSIPEVPVLTGTLVLPQEWLFSREDIDTNGSILIWNSDITGHLLVIDVTDKRLPKILGSTTGVDDHTVSCVLNCTWVYGSDGRIVDITNPALPKRSSRRWYQVAPDGGPGHDVTEVKPGFVLTATSPMLLLDVRENPTFPTVVAEGHADLGYMHSVAWPRSATDRFILTSTESGILDGICDNRSGAFQVWDTTNSETTNRFQFVAQHRVKNGNYLDGNPAYDATACSAHWFDAHPTFANGGLVAAAWYEHGTRFLQVSPAGGITEVGYFMPYAGATGAIYWITDEIAYSVDYNRGLDVLRFKR